MSGSSSAVSGSSSKAAQKHLWSPSEVAELTAAAVAAMPTSLSQAANLSLTTAAAAAAVAGVGNKKLSTTHRTENGDIVHHQQSTHRGNNATLVTSTTTTIHHHLSGALKPTTTTTTTTSVQQQQFSIHAHTSSTHNSSHGHHHHHHHLPPPSLVNSNLLLANGSALVPSSAAAAALDPALVAANHASLVASPSFQGDLNKIDLGLNSDDADVQLEAAKKLRGLLSSERDLLIRQVRCVASACPHEKELTRWLCASCA